MSPIMIDAQATITALNASNAQAKQAADLLSKAVDAYIIANPAVKKESMTEVQFNDVVKSFYAAAQTAQLHLNITKVDLEAALKGSDAEKLLDAGDGNGTDGIIADNYKPTTAIPVSPSTLGNMYIGDIATSRLRVLMFGQNVGSDEALKTLRKMDTNGDIQLSYTEMQAWNDQVSAEMVAAGVIKNAEKPTQKQVDKWNSSIAKDPGNTRKLYISDTYVQATYIRSIANVEIKPANAMTGEPAVLGINKLTLQDNDTFTKIFGKDALKNKEEILKRIFGSDDKLTIGQFLTRAQGSADISKALTDTGMMGALKSYEVYSDKSKMETIPDFTMEIGKVNRGFKSNGGQKTPVASVQLFSAGMVDGKVVYTAKLVRYLPGPNNTTRQDVIADLTGETPMTMEDIQALALGEKGLNIPASERKYYSVELTDMNGTKTSVGNYKGLKSKEEEAFYRKQMLKEFFELLQALAQLGKSLRGF